MSLTMEENKKIFKNPKPGKITKIRRKKNNLFQKILKIFLFAMKLVFNLCLLKCKNFKAEKGFKRTGCRLASHNYVYIFFIQSLEAWSAWGVTRPRWKMASRKIWRRETNFLPISSLTMFSSEAPIWINSPTCLKKSTNLKVILIIILASSSSVLLF